MERVNAGNAAVVLLSGGLDSTVCLYWTRRRFARTCALTFDYAQPWRRELDCAAKVARLASVPQFVLPINTYAAMTALKASPDPPDERLTSRPANFIPGRNLIFFTLAAAFAVRFGARNLVGGMTLSDRGSYPDCRPDTLLALEQAIRLGLGEPFAIHAPLVAKSKMETILLGRELGALPALAETHSCYRGAFPPCRVCPPCLVRRHGFAEAGIVDPLLALNPR